MSTLRELTAREHEIAENTLFMRLLICKGLKPTEYLQYLTQLELIYSALEFVATREGIMDEFKGISRVSKIREDIEELSATTKSRAELCWQTIAYHNQIVRMTDRKEILAHFYVRFAGDMYGGQMLKSLVPSTGRMYDFGDNLPILRQKMREISTPDLAEYAKDAFSRTTDVVNDIMKVGSF